MHRIVVLSIMLTCVAKLFAQTPQWEIVPSPNGAKCKMPYPLCLTPEHGNVLYATAAISATDVWAIGAEPHQSAVLTATLAEHRDGTQWSVVSTPRVPYVEVQLNSISAWPAMTYGLPDSPTTYRVNNRSAADHWSNAGTEVPGRG